MSTAAAQRFPHKQGIVSSLGCNQTDIRISMCFSVEKVLSPACR